MISVLIVASDDEAALARLLTQLVPAAAEGLVRDVLVVGAAGPSRDVALDAGATLVEPGQAPLGGARGEWLLGLPLGARLRPEWMEVVSRHLATPPPTPARLARTGLWPSGRRDEGWLAPLALASGGRTGEKDLERLARRRGRVLRVLERP
jgi:hypothetical protein